ncbi:MAG: branched-chain amino acid transport system II carrier protein [Deltaproteobacteria bacterium]|jgi:LIVCS family branched-chain amino acid:cation transporter|nr:branched-chain amino acid transport system II carrier protein [Deltaproteobacteria bacterium]
MKQLSIDSLIVGFALFAMFFGAGNIIFPPYVGLASGPEWMLGYLCYYIADVGLALLAIFAMLRANSIDKVEGIMLRLGKTPSLIMMGAAVVCLGPLLAVPRTGATTFSMSVIPLAGTDAMWLQIIFTMVYFGLTLLLSLNESKLVDIVGRYLTPLLVIGLFLMIIVGAINPIGPISDMPKLDNVVWTGISSGYQTMDVLAALVFGLIVVNALKAKGYTSPKHKLLSVGISSIVAGVLLLLIYGGLCYLGATVSTMYPEDIDKGLLVVSISKHIFGEVGSVILSVTVALACLTTAVALVGATGTFFSTVSHGKLPYKAVVTVVCVFSAVVANFGLSNIISLAAPILTVIYPGALVVVLLSLFDNQISNDNIFKFATAGALVVSFCEVMGWYFPDAFSFINALPFQAAGFSWVIPAVVCGIIGTFKKSAPHGEGTPTEA